jgi:catechol 2,3-dioxygenase-like lactoylglutathione lyase family enzyme
MLREHPIHATIPATDLERARAFYADKLGLTPTREEPAGLVYETPGGAWFRLYRTPYAGTAQHTVAGWRSKTWRPRWPSSGPAGWSLRSITLRSCRRWTA